MKPAAPRSEPAKRRRRTRVLRIPVLPEEAQLIEARASAAGQTIAAYFRDVGTRYQARSTIDGKEIAKMQRINADLSQLGGLIKLWLDDDEKLDAYPPEQVLLAVRTALARIDGKQRELRRVIGRVFEPE